MTRNKIAAALAAILVLPSMVAPAFADDWHEHDRDRDHNRDRARYEHRVEAERHARYEHHFVDRDWDRWHRGRWVHARHGGHEGWWWVIGDAWYFYPAPVYPYPDPYMLPMIVAPAPVVQQQCREYQGDAIVNGSNQPFYGTACLEPDGQWHIVSR